MKTESTGDAEAQVNAETPAAPKTVPTTPAELENETTSAVPSQSCVQRLDEVFLRSAFQQVRAADAEIQSGLEAVLKLQLDAATAPIEPTLPETASQPLPRTLDEAFLRSAFLKVRTADMEIQTGIETVLKVQLDALTTPVEPSTPEATPVVQEFQKVALKTEFAEENILSRDIDAEQNRAATASSTPPAEQITASKNTTETPEPSLAEVAEAVFSESKTTTTPQQAAQKSLAPAEEFTQAASSKTVTANSDASSNNIKSPVNAAKARGSDAVAYKSSARSKPSAEVIRHDDVMQDILDEVSREGAAAAQAAGKKKAQKPLASEEMTFQSAVDRELYMLRKKSRTTEEQPDPNLVGKAQLSRTPRNVQALYLQPLRRVAEYGVPSCDLQLRSYSVRPLESFCDFALRAAYYCGLPAYGPVPLPKIIERWTVPKSSFIFKKSQENFERITRRRLIQIRDGHPQTVQMWLAFLQKHQQAAVGMKANIWEFSSIGKSEILQTFSLDTEFLTHSTDVAKEMDKAYEEALEGVNKSFDYLGQTRAIETAEKVDEILHSERYRMAAGR